MKMTAAPRAMRHATCRSLCVGLLIGLSACAARPKVPDVFWPDPPDPPRIKYVGSLQSKADLGGRSLRDILVGGDKTIALYQPMGLALSPDGERLYVADRAWNYVFIFDFEAGSVRTLGAEGRYPLAWPVGVAVDGQENVYVTDTGTSTVRVYDPAGHFVRAIGKEQLMRPTGVAIDAQRGRLYVVDTGKSHSADAHHVLVFDLDGNLLQTIGRRGNGDGEFNFPTFCNLDAAGRLYVADSVNNRIQVFDRDGKFLWKFGRPGDQIGDFARPKGVAVDNSGNIYVVDSRWSNVQIFNQQGQLLLIFGGVGTYPGLLTNPTAIVINRNNKIYVADTFGRRVSIYELVDPSPGDRTDMHSMATPREETQGAQL